MAVTRKTILLVEDQDDQIAFLTNLLSAEGYRTIVATDNVVGLRKSKNKNPDLVIIDMMMPADQGIRLYRALKANDNLSSLPVVMISSIDKRMFFQCHQIQEPRAKKGLPLPDAYIETPPEAEELLLAVERLAQTEPPGRATEHATALPPLTGNRKSEPTP